MKESFSVMGMILISIFLLSFPECPNDGDPMPNVAAPDIPHLWFVDASQLDDSGDGRSWGTAKKTIQAVVELAGPGDKVFVFVREGTYTSGTTAPVVVMKNGVGVYGGFIGAEEK